jgi:transposase
MALPYARIAGANKPSEKGKVMAKITRVGVDLAKNLIVIHAVDARERVASRKAISRQKFLEWLANLEPCNVAMEACSAAHFWGRKLRALSVSTKVDGNLGRFEQIT